MPKDALTHSGLGTPQSKQKSLALLLALILANLPASSCVGIGAPRAPVMPGVDDAVALVPAAGIGC
jgi:hypothetical protein